LSSSSSSSPAASCRQLMPWRVASGTSSQMSDEGEAGYCGPLSSIRGANSVLHKPSF
jgi:hypothetical protein